jgi:uncharacterized protein
VSARQAQVIVDCDVHNAVPPGPAFARHLPERWRRYYERVGVRTHGSRLYFVTLPRARASRADSWPPSGLPPGADLDFAREQLLDRYPIGAAVLNPIDMLKFAEEFDEYAAALTRGLNDWTAADWLEPEPRFVASICVAFEHTQAAVDEVHRLGDDPRFVQVLLNVRTRDPLGHRRYWPIYEAAAAHDLPVALHVGGAGGNAITGTGWPSYYFEDHAGFAQAFQHQVISLVASGVFAAFPTLKFVLQEGGFTWMPAMMWRMDMAHALLREEVEHLQEPPSVTLRRHFWFTTQPIEEPERPEYLPQVMARLDMPDRILFSSDYPHWDFDDPHRAIPREIPASLRAGIMAGNAIKLYGFDETALAAKQGPSARLRDTVRYGVPLTASARPDGGV